MGIYINKGNGLFRQARNSEYIDKSALIAVVNQTLLTEKRYTCVTRSRRFGKSMAAKMLAAYYDNSCESRSLFADLVMIPRKNGRNSENHPSSLEDGRVVTDVDKVNVDVPAIIVELKYTGTTGTTIDQIHDRRYPDKVAEYTGDILLVAITYDKKTKEHHCEIETVLCE